MITMILHLKIIDYQKKNNELKLADQRDWSLSSNVNYGYKNNKTLDKDVYSVGVGLDGTYKGIGIIVK